MVPTKRMLCLANSRKLSGRCIAGIELGEHGQPLGWIRPVSHRPSAEISEEERRYQDGTDVRVLDIVDIPVQRHQPCDYQQENWLIDPGYYWRRVTAHSSSGLRRFVHRPAALWTPHFSTYHGRHDRIPLATALGLESSLRLIEVPALTLNVFAPGANFGDAKRRVQGMFSHAGQNYRLWVTDPLIERSHLARDDGCYNFGPAFLTISLGEPHEDWVYKLIATVIKAGD